MLLKKNFWGQTFYVVNKFWVWKMLGKKNQVQKHIGPGKMLGQKRFESGKKNSGPRIRANLPRTNVTCTNVYNSSGLLIYGNLRCFDKFQLSWLSRSFRNRMDAADGLVVGFRRIMPPCGSILQPLTYQIAAQKIQDGAEWCNTVLSDWSGVWQKSSA